jgi:hypothetical protein
MTTAARTLINRLESLGYRVLMYRRGVLYIAGIGCRDTEWAIRVIRRAEG